MPVVALAIPVEGRAPPTFERRQGRVLGDAAAEVAIVAAFYQWYSVVRFWVGGSTAMAERNAIRVVGWERALGIFNESTVQAAALAHPALMQAATTYYGTMHFFVPVVALIVLYRRDRPRYRIWRNALAWASVLAVVVFALFPTMPPRLLPSVFQFTNVTAPGVDRPLVPALYNGFAAMPSLHAAFAAWAAVALWPVLRSRWTRALLVAHFVVIVGVVIVTANHFYLDVAAGVVLIAVAAAIAHRTVPARTTNAWVAAGVLSSAAVLIWLPRAATLPLTLDVAAAAAVGAMAVTARRTPAQAAGTGRGEDGLRPVAGSVTEPS